MVLDCGFHVKPNKLIVSCCNVQCFCAGVGLHKKPIIVLHIITLSLSIYI